MRTRGRPPSTLTGQVSVRAEHSPWWDKVASELGLYGILVGSTYSVEELAQMLPPYPNGARPKARTAMRRLTDAGALELVERGPNGSLGRGARYRILPERPPTPAGEPVIDNAGYLEDAVERMTKGKR